MPQINITKETLISLKSGNHEAFEAVFLNYFNKVKYFINGLIKSEADAEELAQEIFVKIWTNREQIDPEKSFNTYVYISARNTAFNFIKKKLVRESYAADTQYVQSENDAEDSEDVVIAKELDLLISMIVMNMPERRREIFELSRKEGLSNEEIADRLKISKKTIDNQLSLALKELKEAVRTFVMLFA